MADEDFDDCNEFRSIERFPDYLFQRTGHIWSRIVDRTRGLRIGPWHRLNPSPDRHGYPRVRLRDGGARKTLRVHSLILEAFVGPCPPRHEVCHKDGTRTNNAVENLRWGTRTDNMADCIEHGRSNRGTHHPLAVLNEQAVREIREKAASGMRQSALAREYGVSHETISSIVRRKNWGYVDPELADQENHEPGPRRGNRCWNARLTPEIVLEIRRKIESGTSCRDVAREYRISPSTVNDLLAKRTWAHVL